MAWIGAKIAHRQEWAPGLVTLGLDTEVPGFTPGQFANLALEIGGERVKRPYSLASAAHAPAEFYLTLLPGGCFTPALLSLRVGDPIELEDRANGFFTLQYVPPARHAWLIATGTGLGPFISMLRSPELWQRFERVVLVHGVRVAAHLAYNSELSQLVATRPAQFTYVPLVSREEPGPGVLPGRITDALAAGRLEAAAALSLAPADTHVLLCGNPQMIDDMESALGKRGLRRHRQRQPGHITTERYW